MRLSRWARRILKDSYKRHGKSYTLAWGILGQLSAFPERVPPCEWARLAHMLLRLEAKLGKNFKQFSDISPSERRLP